MTKGKIKILLVEDDIFLAKMYETKLTTENFEVLIANDGEQGVALAQKNKPDTILLDIILPKMDGYQVLIKLKEGSDTKGIPVILLTNLGQKGDVDKGLTLGAKDYLIKAHFTPTEVVNKIKSAINKK